MNLPSIFGRKENAIMDGIGEHFRLVKSAVATFSELVEAVAAGSPRAAELLEGVFDMETRADAIQRSLTVKIAQGAFFGGVREDILNLIERVDNIADSAKDAGRLLAIGRLSDPVTLRVLRSGEMKDFLANLGGAVSALDDLIEALRVSKEAVLSKVHRVEEYEELADSKKNVMLRALFEDPKGVDPIAAIQTRDFLFAADDIADNAEDASDVMLVLVAKGYG